MRNLLAGLMAVVLCAGAALPAQAAEPKIGDVPPAMLGKDREGDVVDLAQHRDKVVVVTFWASWCGPCRKELPILDIVQKSVDDKLLKIIAVNMQDSTEDYRMMMRQMKDYSIAMTRDRDGSISEGYGVKALPNLWIIDPQGKVAAHHVGYGEDSLKSLIDEINRVIGAEQQRQMAASGSALAD